LCGRVQLWWDQHKHHHVFFNPSPFSVIADEYVDQFFRATPLLFFPLLVPVNLDLLFFQYAFVFYIYGAATPLTPCDSVTRDGAGVYLHWGHELPWPDAHHPILNTAFQHYCHHAKSTFNK
jgi:lathosterol oxidase